VGDSWLRVAALLTNRLSTAIEDGTILRHEAALLFAHLVNLTLARLGSIRYLASLGPGAKLAFSDNREFLLKLLRDAASTAETW